MKNQTVLMALMVVMLVFAGFQAVQLVNLQDNIQQGGITGRATSSSPTGAASSGGDILIEANEIPEQVGGCFR